ncbi:MAG: SCO1664 family protein [Nocardioides sp.]
MIPDRDQLSFVDGELVLEGRVAPASNATFLATINNTRVVYKPIAGERPLWDFPDGCLAWREVAAWHVSEALGWNVVPYTFVGGGPHGEGMIQLWQEPDPDQAAVDIVAADAVPRGYCHVFDGIDAHNRPVALVHEDNAALRRVAVFDVLINNGDRKGGHVLPMSDGHRFGVDHGVSFHSDDKLRTVLWGWSGQPLTEPELAAVRQLAEAPAALRESLSGLLTEREIDQFFARAAGLTEVGSMPQPSGEWPAIPWPPW